MKRHTYINVLFVFAILSLFVLCVTGCGHNEQSTQQGDNGNYTVSYQRPIHAGSILVYSRDELIDLINKADVNKYRKDRQDDYIRMFNTIKKSGFIYLAKVSDDKSKDSISLFERDGKNMYFLMPYNKVEDIGVVSIVMFRGELFHVCVNCVDDSFVEKDQNISEYINSRNGRKIIGQTTIRGKEVLYTFEGKGSEIDKNCTLSFIDSDHYLLVKTEASREVLDDFLSVLELEKVPIDK